jgi:hypothetical protein
MRRNVGKVDRSVRVALGVVFTVLAFYMAGYLQIIVGLFAVLGYVTGISGFCPLYHIMRSAARRNEVKSGPSSL